MILKYCVCVENGVPKTTQMGTARIVNCGTLYSSIFKNNGIIEVFQICLQRDFPHRFIGVLYFTKRSKFIKTFIAAVLRLDCPTLHFNPFPQIYAF